MAAQQSKLEVIHPTAAGDEDRLRLLETYKRNSQAYYQTHTHEVRRRQLLYNLNTGRTRFPSPRSIQKYDLQYVASQDKWV
jgi:hypothetical protein